MIMDHILGTLYGMALGDAMGMPSELLSRRRIQEIFGRITTFEDSPEENPAAIDMTKGQFTDDTAQALVILDSLAENDFVPDKGIIAKNLIHWALDTDAFSKNILGPSTKAALHAIQAGEDPEPYTVKAITNGAAMRIAPVGCLFSTDDLPKLAKFVRGVSEATHKTDVALGSAGMVAAAVSAAIEDRSWEEIMQIASRASDLTAAYGEETYSASPKARLQIALELAHRHAGEAEAFSLSLYETIGTTTLASEAVPAALGMAYYFRDPETCSLACANLGGDTDTIGAMAVAICGAKAGASGIPQERIDVLNASNPVDFHAYAKTLLHHRGHVG